MCQYKMENSKSAPKWKQWELLKNFLNFTKWFYTEENLKFKVVKKVKGGTLCTYIKWKI